jgi:alpha-N-acetylglucosamine transferase
MNVSKVLGFHGSDYEKFHLLGYKNPVRTSQETYYISTTQPSQLMLCKISCFHGGVYEECCLLGSDAVALLGTNFSEAYGDPMIGVTTVSELEKLVVTNN